MIYQDKWSRWHDAPVTDADPVPSNNSWIFSAYAVKLGLPIDRAKLFDCYRQCWQTPERFMSRSPGKLTPPFSRDEVLGLAYLDLRGFVGKVSQGWSFCPYPIPRRNILKTIMGLWRLKGAHRNAVWKDGGEPHVWWLAFSVPLTDRAFILRCRGIKVPAVYRLAEWADKKLKPSSKSSALIAWLKYDQMPERQVWVEYFGEDHPFVKVLE